MKKKSKSRVYRLTVPAIRKLRQSMENGGFGGFLVKSAEMANARSVRVRYMLKKKPWVITIEAKRRGN